MPGAPRGAGGRGGPGGGRGGRGGGRGGAGGGGRGPGGPGKRGGGGPNRFGGGSRRRRDDREQTEVTGWKRHLPEGMRRFVPSWKIVLGVFALGFVAFVVIAGVVYARTPIPSPQDGVDAQGTSVFYADNKSKPVLRLGEPRENVDLNKIPQNVQHAVLAAEDRNFYNEPGVSPTGISRAIFKTATGGEMQGGSTITQQLARNYYKGLSQDRTFSRKFKEIFISVRLGNDKPKDYILGTYLNTIYFGRQANGIQAASRAYFHKNVDKLTVSEGALIAAMIQQPEYFHTTGNPATDPARKALEDRWNYVLDGMVKMHWLSEADRAKQRFPVTQKSWNYATGGPQSGYIRDRVQQELATVGITNEQINSAGLKVYTSLNSKWMKYAQEAVKTAGPSSLPKNVRIGLISVDPATGEIPAFYGGSSSAKQADAAFYEAPQVGSSFKPYVLATALKQGFNIKSMIDGHSPQAFNSNGDSVPIGTPGTYKVSNDAGDGPLGVINLVKATQLSVNTAYVKLGMQLGLNDVRDTAAQFGVPTKALDPHKGQAGISLGIANYPAVYQAAGYAAFANGGTPVTPHIITKIVRSNGSEWKLPWTKKKDRILTQEQTAQATEAMRAVVNGGTGKGAALPGRQVAGKTGTTEKSAAAWFVGYVPQLSTAVTMFDAKNKPMTSIPGYGGGVYGGQIPAAIWKAYMLHATQGMKVENFPAPTYSEGTKHLWDTPAPTVTPTPTTSTPTDPTTCSPKDFFKQKCQQSPPPNSPPPGPQPCDSFGLPPGCTPTDPNSPAPGSPEWCAQPQNKNDPRCRNTGTGNGTAQTRKQTLVATKD
jgi:membrane peptidoglycan carboxypeptidase